MQIFCWLTKKGYLTYIYQTVGQAILDGQQDRYFSLTSYF